MAPDRQDSSQAARLGDANSARPASRRVAAEKPYGFSGADRIHARVEFARVQRHGIRAQSPHFVLYALADLPPADSNCDRTRLGITVSRRVGNAVIRNRIKRQVRERFRLGIRAMLPQGAVLVVIARAGAGALDGAHIAAELDDVAQTIALRAEATRA